MHTQYARNTEVFCCTAAAVYRFQLSYICRFKRLHNLTLYSSDRILPFFCNVNTEAYQCIIMPVMCSVKHNNMYTNIINIGEIINYNFTLHILKYLNMYSKKFFLYRYTVIIRMFLGVLPTTKFIYFIVKLLL